MAFKYQKLFTPIKIGNCEIKNRFAMAPMGPLCHANSEILERLIPFNNIDVITDAKATGYP